MSTPRHYLFSRWDTSILARWWWTTDRWLLGSAIALILIGVVLQFGTSPAAAVRTGYASPFHFAILQGVFAAAGASVMLGASVLEPRGVRRVAFVVYAVAIVAMVALSVHGHNAKGATRWIDIAGVRLQPSEFMKPALVVLAAWMFAEDRKGEIWGMLIAFGLYLLAAVLLVMESDFGQIVLITAAFGAAFWVSGVGIGWILVLGAAAIVGLGGAAAVLPHVGDRWQAFMDHHPSGPTQVQRAADAIVAGSGFGRGPGEGIMKGRIPDLQTDFAYSAAAEDYGLLFSLILIGLFAMLVTRGLHRAMKVTDPFEQIAAAGLFSMVGMQAFINIVVNLGLVPTKGMTLPFISYGGSSMLAMGPDHGHGSGPHASSARELFDQGSRRQACRPLSERGRAERGGTERGGPSGRVASSRVAVIAAGGTGGHLFPAQALAEVLGARGWRVVLATDERVQGLAQSFPAERVVTLASATLRRRDALGAPRAALTILAGVLQGRAALAEVQPDVVVGFGGYPSLPALIAAITQGRPTIIHEQNAVSGRANRFLAPYVTAVACAFPTLRKASARTQARAVLVGNPVRPEISALADLAYEAPDGPPDGQIRLLITGGSQGARLLSELIPASLAALPEPLRRRLHVEQQTRPESMTLARSVYADALIDAELAPFFRDMAGRLARAHLVIGRAGASTVTELAVVGRPSILIPLGLALDDDQGQNARMLADGGGAEVAEETGLTQAMMTSALEKLLTNPARLARMAAAARRLARPDAAERLADLVERTAR